VSVPEPPFLLVTDRRQARRSLDDILERAFAAGCRWASIRERDLPAVDQIALAHWLLPLARRVGARLTLHGAPGVAKAAEVDGVHLQAGSNVGAARELLGAGALIGVSVHSAEEAAALDPDVVDYCIVGPVHFTTSKPEYGPALGAEGFAAIARAARVPGIAIGGLTAANLGKIRAAGARGVAVMGGVMRAEEPGREVRDLLAALRTV
jgi:thiamine-phosphate pyrophosphorylase